MKVLGNVIWHIPYLGFLIALIYAICGVFWCISIIGIPVGLGLFQLSLFMLTPFHKRLVSREDLEMLTGEKQAIAVKSWFLIVRILYFPVGLLLAFGAVITICVEFVTILGIPCALVYSKALSTIFNPVNKICVPIAVAEEIEKRKASNALSKYNIPTAQPAVSAPVVVPTPAPAPDTSVQSKETEPVVHKQKMACPQCRKEIEEGWNTCPYCGCNFQEEEKKRQEADNLRYAPKAEPAQTVTVSEVVTPVEKKPVAPSPVSPVSVTSEAPRQSSAPAMQISPRLIGLLVGGLILVAGIVGYFVWYVPYAKDRDALRTYVVADNLFFRSSKIAGVEYNVLSQLHYGAELITYSKDAEWAEVKADDTEGFVSSNYLLEWDDFKLLNDVWGSADTKAYIESTKCRLAIVDYCKRNQLATGNEGWQLHTLQKDVKPNNVLFPRLDNGYDKFTEFAFILKNNLTKERRLAIYSFNEETEEPLFMYEESAPEEGQIKQIRYSRNQYIVSYN